MFTLSIGEYILCCSRHSTVSSHLQPSLSEPGKTQHHGSCIEDMDGRLSEVKWDPEKWTKISMSFHDRGFVLYI